MFNDIFEAITGRKKEKSVEEKSIFAEVLERAGKGKEMNDIKEKAEGKRMDLAGRLLGTLQEAGKSYASRNFPTLMKYWHIGEKLLGKQDEEELHSYENEVEFYSAVIGFLPDFMLKPATNFLLYGDRDGDGDITGGESSPLKAVLDKWPIPVRLNLRQSRIPEEERGNVRGLFAYQKLDAWEAIELTKGDPDVILDVMRILHQDFVTVSRLAYNGEEPVLDGVFETFMNISKEAYSGIGGRVFDLFKK